MAPKTRSGGKKKAESASVVAKKSTPAKQPKKQKKNSKEEASSPAAAPAADNASSSNKKIVTIEACKQWGAFKTRANKILKAVGSQATVEINKEKPGKGNFVVTVEGVEEPIVSLIGMKRPFPPLKALDMDDINAKVIAALS